jgi:RNA polymerase sigma factor (sigma-70 family)
MSQPQAHHNTETLDYYVDYATRYAQHKAKQLSGHFGYNASDQADIVQDLLLDLVERWPNYDPERGTPETFIRHIIWCNVSALIEQKRALKRQFDYEASPIDESVEDEVTANFRTASPRRIDQEYVALATDVAAVMERLSADERELCERLQSQSISKVARDLGIPRSTLFDRVKKLRSEFEEANVHDYFQPEFR